jgi:hypothetical protein
MMMSKRILFVCSGRSDEIETRLQAAGCVVTKAGDGRSAVASSRRYPFDAAVLLSTGSEMDITETALNLRDVSPLMPIVVVTGPWMAHRKPSFTSRIAELIPKTITVQIEELANYLTHTVTPRTPISHLLEQLPSKRTS